MRQNHLISRTEYHPDRHYFRRQNKPPTPAANGRARHVRLLRDRLKFRPSEPRPCSDPTCYNPAFPATQACSLVDAIGMAHSCHLLKRQLKLADKTCPQHSLKYFSYPILLSPNRVKVYLIKYLNRQPMNID